jgi:hypothetical protein
MSRHFWLQCVQYLWAHVKTLFILIKANRICSSVGIICFMNRNDNFLKVRLFSRNVNLWTYQPRSNLMKDENGDLLADSRNILNRWKNYSQILNVHRVSDVRQIEIHTTEPLVPVLTRFSLKLLLQNWKGFNRQVVIKFRKNWFKQEAKY